MNESDFQPNSDGLGWSVSALLDGFGEAEADALPETLPDIGVGPTGALERLAPPILGRSRDLAAPGFFAHMDPPTPWVTWAVSMWTASRNQNLLHPDTAPEARELERRVIAWLAPFFGQSGGHLTPGSTVANLTAMWAAREAGADSVVAGSGAHLSVRKAAHLLAMPYRVVDDWSDPGDVSTSAVVLTAGTTSTGEIEPLEAAPGARWRHADAAWSGPLRLSEQHRHLLDGVEAFDSVAISAHKWLFQPKESAMILFADHESAHKSISVDGAYLAVPNVGVLGSHGATAAPLLATLLAYGRSGIAQMLDQSMALADRLYELVEASDDFVARSRPHTGVLCWRHRTIDASTLTEHLPDDVFISNTTVDGQPWLRSVAANPLADPDLVMSAARQAAATAGALTTAERPLGRASISMQIVDAGSAAAQDAMTAYFNELDRRFDGGFDSSGAFDGDAGNFDQPVGCFIVLLDGERPVGCGGVQRHDARTGEIKRMWLHPGLRGLGLGRDLLTRLEGEAASLGYCAVVLDTNSVLSQALAMYASAGYTPIERYNDNRYAHHWFRKELE